MNDFRKSFAARIGRANELVTLVKGFNGFSPPTPEDSIESMVALTASIEAINTTETTLMTSYRVAVKERQKLFFTNPLSIEKLFTPIKDIIKSGYGVDSAEVAVLESIIRKMRSSKKTTVVVADPTNPEQETTISQSEKSYGAITKYFNDFITIVSSLEAYQPKREVLKVESLQSKATEMIRLNESVTQKISLLRSTKANRLNLYDELRVRALRIKAYVKAEYGADSIEYKSIGSMRF